MAGVLAVRLAEPRAPAAQPAEGEAGVIKNSDM